MNEFKITSKDGVDLGTYSGETKADALTALARDAGYSDYATACDVAYGDLIVEPAIRYYVVPSDNHDDIYAAGDPDGYEHVEDAAADMVALAMTPCFEGPWAIVSPIRRADNGKVLQWEALGHRELALAIDGAHYHATADEENNELSRVLVDASDEEPIGYITGDCSAEYRGES